MKRDLDAKKEKLLKAIVQEYIHSAAPVASLSLGGHHGLDASSATLRNWMGELENMGYLKQPHPSAGRIPTDRGYRCYVDLLMEKENLSAKEKRLIARELDAGFHEIEDLLKEATEIIAHIAGCATLAFHPSSIDDAVNRLELVSATEEKVLLVLLTQKGFVFDRLVEFEISKERLEVLSRILNERLHGIPISQIHPRLVEDMADEMVAHLFSKIAELISEVVEERNKNRILVEGTHLLLDQPEFQDLNKFKSALEILKKEERLSRFLGRIGAGASLHVFIGDENPIKDFNQFSVIAAPYGNEETGYGALAIVGPTRMEYGHLIPLVQYAASILSRTISEFHF